MAIELVFETHSTTVDNEQGRATGWLPGQLSERGQAQAQQLGRRLDDGITAVFSSDLTRAAQTAPAAFAGSAVPVLYDWRRMGVPGQLAKSVADRCHGEGQREARLQRARARMNDVEARHGPA